MAALPGFADADAYTAALLPRVVAVARAAQALPKGTDWHFHASADPAFRRTSRALRERLLATMDGLLALVPGGGSLQRDDDDDDDRTERLARATTLLLERASTLLDLAHTRLATPGLPLAALTATSVVTSGSAAFSEGAGGAKKKAVVVLHAANVARPQLSFADAVDNSAFPFEPKLRSKPHALVPLEASLRLVDDSGKDYSGAGDDTGDNAAISAHLGSLGFVAAAPRYQHPYHAELERFSVPPAQLTASAETDLPIPSLATTPCTWINTPAQLAALCATLDGETEFAVDLEAHSYRSYQGFTCLMQLSTRTADFLVDTLALRAHLHTLNSSFANPAILKVLHGADGDVVWLQRDFGVYLVNLFDTGQAMRVLGLPRFSLLYLVQTYCGVTLNKEYQLADWRVRPIDPAMLNYAREDTHYLLPIKDRLVSELLARGNDQANLLRNVYQRSTDICRRTYENPPYDPASALDLYSRHNRPLKPTQLRVFKALHAWRDRVARLEDESIGFVLPNNLLFDIAEGLPRNSLQCLSLCKPTPPLVRIHLQDLLHIVAEALENTESLATQLPVLVHSGAPLPKDVSLLSSSRDDAGLMELSELPPLLCAQVDPAAEAISVSKWALPPPASSKLAQLLHQPQKIKPTDEVMAVHQAVLAAFAESRLFAAASIPQTVAATPTHSHVIGIHVVDPLALEADGPLMQAEHSSGDNIASTSEDGAYKKKKSKSSKEIVRLSEIRKQELDEKKPPKNQSADKSSSSADDGDNGTEALAKAKLAKVATTAEAQAEGPSFDYNASGSRLLTPGILKRPAYTGGDEEGGGRGKKKHKK